MKTKHPNAEQIQKSRNFLLLTPLALLLVLTMTGQASAQHIITFDAPNSGTGAFQGTEASGINLQGTITGNVTDNGNGTHGFVRTPVVDSLILMPPARTPSWGAPAQMALTISV
jgi:hypothetical protein